MSVGKIIVPMVAGEDDQPGLHGVFSAAKALSAHIDAVFCRPDPDTVYIYTGVPPTEQSHKEIRDNVDRSGKAASLRSRRYFETACEKAGIPRLEKPLHRTGASFSWRELKGDPKLDFPKAAQGADLVVFPPSETDTGVLFGSLLEETLLKSGCPVLVLPMDDAIPDFHNPMIAWDGGTACARAVSAWLSLDAVPEKATVLHVVEPNAEVADTNGIIDRLEWRGIAVARKVRKRGMMHLGKAILETAQELNSGLIVMGGYGRFRYSEALFGGVTRYVIGHSNKPVLMMH